VSSVKGHGAHSAASVPQHSRSKIVAEPVVEELIDNSLDYLLKAAGYAKDGSDSNLKYSIIFLGMAIEIVLKARLLKEHWSLIFANVDKASNAALSSGDFKSADFETVVTRLEQISSVKLSNRALADLDNLRKLRNRAVHFTLAINADQVSSLLAKGHNFFLEFGRANLPGHIDPNSQVMAQVTENLREFDHFVKLRLKAIKPRLKEATRLLECDRCSQPALSIGEGEPVCLFCGYKTTCEELAEDLSDGGVVQKCPECGADACALIVLNNDEAVWDCMSCGTREKGREYSSCPRCGQLTANDGVCDDCWDEWMDKD
jgi:hypothetical protein